jgi:predicted TIM-barrel fold metal-dependent hydrolase
MGLPRLADEHWRPVLEAAQHHALSINFHIGVEQGTSDVSLKKFTTVPADEHTRRTSVGTLGNAKAIADAICLGVCHRYPKLKLVSVESGIGWLPYLADSLDWHWKSFGGHREFPDRELPSYYFRRQVYGSFWFESRTVEAAANEFPDNIMFETDFPHPTSLSPGPASSAESPRVTATKAVENLSDEVARKILFDNGANLYHLL